MVTADLYDRMIVANDPYDGDIDEKCMFFVSPGLFVFGFLSPSQMFFDGCGRSVACNGSTIIPVNESLSLNDDVTASSFRSICF